MLKAQAAVENAFILALLVVFVVTVAVPAVREAELDSVLSSCRLAGVNWASGNSSRSFLGLGFEFDGRRVLLKPQFFELGSPEAATPDELKLALLEAARSAISPSLPKVSDPNACVAGVNYEYCVA